MSLRDELNQELFEFLDDMDPSGKNTERLRSFLIGMSDKEYYEYMDDFLNDDRKYIQVAYEPYNNPVTIEFIEKIAKKYHIIFYHKIAKPYVNGNPQNPTVTPHEVMVLYLPVKRLKQMVATKSHTSVTNTKRDAKTGQVTGSDKTARVTDVEGYSLIVQELYASARESFGPMADNEAAFFEMQRQIQKNGEVSLADLPNDPLSQKTTNTVFYLMLGSCISTNLIEDSGYLLPITLKSQEDRSSTVDRGQ